VRAPRNVNVPLQAESSRTGLQFAAKTSIPNNEQARCLTMIDELAESLQQGPMVLFRFEATHNTEDHVIGRQP